MKKNILQTTKIIILGLMLSAGFVFAQSWTPPSSLPTLGNTDAPINSGPSVQFKAGALGTGPFATLGKSDFYGNVSVLPVTNTSTPSDVYLLGNVGIGIPSPYPSTEKLDVNGNIKIPSIAYTGNFGNLTIVPPDGFDARLCADQTGKIVGCIKGTRYFDHTTFSNPFVVPDGVFRITVIVTGPGMFFDLYPAGSYDLNVLPGMTFNLVANPTQGNIQIAW